MCRWLIFSPSLSLALSLLFSFALVHFPSHSHSLFPSLCLAGRVWFPDDKKLYFQLVVLYNKKPYLQLVVLKPITYLSRLLSPISFITRI